MRKPSLSDFLVDFQYFLGNKFFELYTYSARSISTTFSIGKGAKIIPLLPLPNSYSDFSLSVCSCDQILHYLGLMYTEG